MQTASEAGRHLARGISSVGDSIAEGLAEYAKAKDESAYLTPQVESMIAALSQEELQAINNNEDKSEQAKLIRRFKDDELGRKGKRALFASLAFDAAQKQKLAAEKAKAEFDQAKLDFTKSQTQQMTTATDAAKKRAALEQGIADAFKSASQVPTERQVPTTQNLSFDDAMNLAEAAQTTDSGAPGYISPEAAQALMSQLASVTPDDLRTSESETIQPSAAELEAYDDAVDRYKRAVMYSEGVRSGQIQPPPPNVIQQVDPRTITAEQILERLLQGTPTQSPQPAFQFNDDGSISPYNPPQGVDPGNLNLDQQAYNQVISDAEKIVARGMPEKPTSRTITRQLEPRRMVVETGTTSVPRNTSDIRSDRRKRVAERLSQLGVSDPKVLGAVETAAGSGLDDSVEVEDLGMGMLAIKHNDKIVDIKQTQQSQRPTEAMAKAQTYVVEMATMENEIENMGDVDQTAVMTKAQEYIPRSDISDPKVLGYIDARDKWIEAALRDRSGAAIANHEYDSARRQYFPTIGDSQKNIERKKQLRRLVRESLVRRAQGLPYDESIFAGYDRKPVGQDQQGQTMQIFSNDPRTIQIRRSN